MADVVNMVVVLSFDAALLYTCGIKSIIYLLLGTVMGGGMHPMAGHLISEHYMFIKARTRAAPVLPCRSTGGCICPLLDLLRLGC